MGSESRVYLDPALAGQADPETILEEAQRLVHGDRGADYGPPWEDFERTVDIFRAWTGVELTAEQGIQFMVCVKLSRQANKAKRDNLVDAAGYLDCLDQTINRP